MKHKSKNGEAKSKKNPKQKLLASPIPQPNATDEPVYTYDEDIAGEPSSLWCVQGHWYLGNSPQEAKLVTVVEAMQWYARCRPFDRGSTGDIAPLVAVAAEQLRHVEDEQAARIRAMQYAPHEAWMDDGGHSEVMINSLDEIENKEYTARIEITLGIQGWFYLRMAAANRDQTMGECIADALRLTDWVHNNCSESTGEKTHQG